MTDFLYPFLADATREDAATESLLTALLDDLAASAAAKAHVSAALQRATVDSAAEVLGAAAEEMAERVAAGGRLFTFGNGGSSTDAAGLAELFVRPPWGRSLPASCLADDTAVVTALANDVGFELVFARQLIAHAAGPADIAVGISTSGTSTNMLAAFAEAAARGMLTIGVAGYDGGAFAQHHAVAHCLVVASDSIHRIQEAQASLGVALWAAVQQRSGTPAGV